MCYWVSTLDPLSTNLRKIPKRKESHFLRIF